MFTPFEDLNTLLKDLIGSVRAILGDTFVGAYLQGSFALGAAYLLSDCAFIIAWAGEHLDPRWRPLLAQVIEDRALGWDPAEPPRPGSLDAAYAFAAYAESFTGGNSPR